MVYVQWLMLTLMNYYFLLVQLFKLDNFLAMLWQAFQIIMKKKKEVLNSNLGNVNGFNLINNEAIIKRENDYFIFFTITQVWRIDLDGRLHSSSTSKSSNNSLENEKDKSSYPIARLAGYDDGVLELKVVDHEDRLLTIHESVMLLSL